jgi:hypothetical protein
MRVIRDAVVLRSSVRTALLLDARSTEHLVVHGYEHGTYHE